MVSVVVFPVDSGPAQQAAPASYAPEDPSLSHSTGITFGDISVNSIPRSESRTDISYSAAEPNAGTRRFNNVQYSPQPAVT